MSNNDSNRIVQIMPATRGETAVYYEPEGNRWTVPVIAWALYANGTVWPITASMDGDASYAGEGAPGWYLYQPAAEGLDWDEQEREAKRDAIVNNAVENARLDARLARLGPEERNQLIRRARAEAVAQAEAGQ